MEVTGFILFALATIHAAVAQNRGVIRTVFFDKEMTEIDLAVFGESVKLTCEIQCDVGETVDLIGPNRSKLLSGECWKEDRTGNTIAIMGYLDMNESLEFGEYKCKYKDRVIEESASSWDYHYRTCSKAERQSMSLFESSSKGIFVVDRNERSCHAIRNCGARQHFQDIIPRIMCPANERSICHAAEKDKYSSALLSQQFVKSCTEKPLWYISYAGVPVVLNSLVQLRKEIHKFKLHCPIASDGKRLQRRVNCHIDGHSIKVETGNCTEAVDLLIPDAVFAESGGKPFHCDGEGDVYATLIYANPDQNMTCVESKDESIKCKFEPGLWRKYNVKKSIQCSSTEREDEWLSQGDFVLAPNPDQCKEYSIVAEVSYVHPGTHEVFKIPLLESGPFRKRSKQTDNELSSVTMSATASESKRTYPSSQTTTMTPDGKPCPTTTAAPCSNRTRIREKDISGNSADLIDPGSWCTGIAMWSVVQAMLKLR